MKEKFNLTGLIRTDIIQGYMKEHHLTQKQFAEICEIHIWNLQSVLKSHTNFRLIYLFKIAKVMQLNVHKLFKK